MKKISMLAVLAIVSSVSGCATLSDAGKKVHIERVTKDTMSVEAAKKKLKGMGCTLIGNIEAPIATGSSNEHGRLIIGLKNKTAEAGGNAVISSLEPNFGMPIFTKGIAYKCPKDLVAEGV